MEDKIKKISAVAMGLLVVLVSITVIRLSNVWAEEQEKSERLTGHVLDFIASLPEEDEEVLQYQIQIEIPPGTKTDQITVENEALTQLVTITVPGMDRDYYYDHPLLGSSDHIDNLIMGSERGNGIIEITLDAVYEVQYEVRDDQLYLDFAAPSELYEKVIVVDAGHGGDDPGSVKQGVYEKDLNLAIVLELKALLDQHPEWKVYYTRTTDVDMSPKKRAQFANKVHANLFISVHNNSTQDGRMADYAGTYVMYDEKKPTEGLSSARLAQICLEEFTAAAGSVSRGIIDGHSIYIIRNSDVPVALVEAGFMTDYEELERLCTPEYQKLAAQGIYNGILRAFEEGF